MNKITVKEENRVAVTNPIVTIQDDDKFQCPNCKTWVTIEYVNYPHGTFPNVGQTCPGCNIKYGILL